MNYEFIIPDSLTGLRIDKALAILSQGHSRSAIQKAIKKGNGTINGLIISNLSNRVKENDLINITITEEALTHLVPTACPPLDILYEDEDLIVLNKAAGVNVHPGAGSYNDTLVNYLLFHIASLSDINGSTRPGIVHRLDKNTTGLMVVAKNNKAHIHLAAQLAARTLGRRYKVLIWGIMHPQTAVIDKPVSRSKLDREKMIVDEISGKKAVTFYQTQEILAGGLFSLVECKLETGRTHQIRVHLSHAGHPVVGDPTYGRKKKITAYSDELKQELGKITAQLLHSFFISFIHPSTGKLMEFEKELPINYNKFLTIARRADRKSSFW